MGKRCSVHRPQTVLIDRGASEPMGLSRKPAGGCWIPRTVHLRQEPGLKPPEVAGPCDASWRAPSGFGGSSEKLWIGIPILYVSTITHYKVAPHLRGAEEFHRHGTAPLLRWEYAPNTASTMPHQLLRNETPCTRSTNKAPSVIMSSCHYPVARFQHPSGKFSLIEKIFPGNSPRKCEKVNCTKAEEVRRIRFERCWACYEPFSSRR